MHEIDVYDFDGTIYNGNSSIDFLMFALKKKKSLIKYIPRILIFFILYLIGLISTKKFKEEYFSFVKDCPHIYIGGIDSTIYIGNHTRTKRGIIYLNSTTYYDTGEYTATSSNLEIANKEYVNGVRDSGSTLNIKQNVIKKDISDILSILDKIDIYDYNYIPEVNDGRNDYGYIIDYLEKIPGIEKYLTFNDDKVGNYKTKKISLSNLIRFLLSSVVALNKEVKEIKGDK